MGGQRARQTLEIAAEAARRMLEEGLEFAAAKAKAARSLGFARVELPRNEAVEDEVRAQIALFHADEQPAELAALRALARSWMQRLAEFRPHLSGAVWRGIATRRSAVHLDLYCDDPKAAELALINAGVDFDVGGVDHPRHGPVDVLAVAGRVPDWPEPVTIFLFVHDLDDLRGALTCDAQGRSWRGDLAALERSIATAAP